MDRRSHPRLLFARAPGDLYNQLDPGVWDAFEVTDVRSYSAAMQQLEAHPFDLILIDEGLMHGKALPLCAELCRRESPPVLIQVHEPRPAFLDAALAAGAQDFILGPAQPRELRARGRLAHTAKRTSERISTMMRRLHELSKRDPLTKLNNRDGFEEKALVLLEDAQMIHLMVLDLDHFKSINDLFGHAAGDGVLQLVAQTIAASLRHSDVAARWGGEEFVVLLQNTTHGGALAAAEKLRRGIGALQWEGLETHHPISVSIGLTGAHISKRARHRPKELLQKLFERADHLLYRAKHEGRNRVHTDLHTPPY